MRFVEYVSPHELSRQEMDRDELKEYEAAQDKQSLLTIVGPAQNEDTPG
jgi:hypothetical protein